MSDLAIDSLARSGQSAPRWLWRNGHVVPWAQATVHVNAVGHASVAAVFEGIKAYLAHDGGRLLVFRLDEHIERLFDSARLARLGLRYTEREIRQAVLDLLRANTYRQDVYLRPWAFPAGIIREQMVPAGAPCEVVIDSWAFDSALGTRRGCAAAVSSWTRISENAMPPKMKAFANYHNGRLAMIEARDNGHDWPVLLNERHKVSEAPGACIAIVRKGIVATPSLASGILDSLTRSAALTLLSEHGTTVEERDVDRSELRLADEIFFMGTGWEILPVTRIDGLPVGTGEMGPVTRWLDAAFEALVRGRSESHADWLTEVPFPTGRVACR